VNTKPIVPRELARSDIEDIIDHYLDNGDFNAALGFVDALEQAYAHIGRQPASGSPRYGHELNLPGLRFWAVTRYPYLVFYFEHENLIDVWRVLHGRRDIPAWMTDT
jgi:toxin ParE1/3/4